METRQDLGCRSSRSGVVPYVVAANRCRSGEMLNAKRTHHCRLHCARVAEARTLVPLRGRQHDQDEEMWMDPSGFVKDATGDKRCHRQERSVFGGLCRAGGLEGIPQEILLEVFEVK